MGRDKGEAVSKVSLLHATYRAGPAALATRSIWLNRAAQPDRVDHIFAMDHDDPVVPLAADFKHVVSERLHADAVTAVTNWNAAAATAEGDLLFVISDDLLPPLSWDDSLREVVRGLDPQRVAFAVKISDNDDPKDTLLRHPVISAEYFRALGLFSPLFSGLFADDDISVRAFTHAFIVDGRRIMFLHEHPLYDTNLPPSQSQAHMSRPDQYLKGRAAFYVTWSRRQRQRPRRALSPHRVATQSAVARALMVRWIRGGSDVRYFAGRVSALSRRLKRVANR